MAEKYNYGHLSQQLATRRQSLMRPNMISILFRRLRQRAEVFGILKNERSIMRLVGGLMLDTNNEWAVARRH